MRRTFALLLGLDRCRSACTAGAETLKVAVAQRGFWDSTIVDIAEKQGFFKEAGLDIEVFYTEGGASTLDAAASPAPSMSRCRTASSA